MGNKQAKEPPRKGDNLTLADELYNKAWMEKKDHKKIPLYERAAAEYRLARQLELSGECLYLLGECNEKEGNNVDAAQNYEDAGKMFAKAGKLGRANQVFEAAISLLEDMKRSEHVNALHKEIANLTATAFAEGKVDVKEYKEAVETSLQSMVSGGEYRQAEAAQSKLIDLLLKRQEWVDAQTHLGQLVKRTTLDLDTSNDKIAEYILKYLYTGLVIATETDDYTEVESAFKTYDSASGWSESKTALSFGDLLDATRRVDYAALKSAADMLSFMYNSDVVLDILYTALEERLKKLEAAGKKPVIRSQADLIGDALA